jgi:hypothetical protein
MAAGERPIGVEAAQLTGEFIVLTRVVLLRMARLPGEHYKAVSRTAKALLQ